MNIGVAGLGFMGQTHLGIYSKLPGVNVVAAYTRTPGDRKASSTGNLGRPQPAYDLSRVRKYYRWQELIDDSTIDAVDICLPTDQHAPVVMAALAAGKHVFCEKPMALNENECDRMIAARNDSGRTLMVGHVLRFFSEYEYLKEAARSNEHREILSATFIRSCGVPDWSDWLIDENRSGGAILDLLIHDVDQILELFGMPERVTAKRL
ncbi:MAG: Gfo/Idh/MocA family oxidoreductase, partial [Acidobacteriaceae bacterium]|nr:Gfo/Idh/MocA family oxidoreductase [Acidobacteriaceae bacterium]